MENLQIRQGETLSLTIQSDDETADTVRLVVKKEGQSVIIDETANFSVIDGKTIALIETNDTNQTPDTYEYMLTITYSDGTIKKLPDASSCDEGDCELPTITICEAIDLGVS